MIFFILYCYCKLQFITLYSCPVKSPNEKITKWKKPKKRNEKPYIFQLHYYLTYIIPHTLTRRLQGVLYRIIYWIVNVSDFIPSSCCNMLNLLVLLENIISLYLKKNYTILFWSLSLIYHSNELCNFLNPFGSCVNFDNKIICIFCPYNHVTCSK